MLQPENRLNFQLPLLLLFCWLAVACSDRDSFPDRGQDSDTYRIAVVLPYSSGMEQHWHNVVDWALANLNEALSAEGMQITAEWYDEDREDMRALFDKLTDRQDIAAIIGPLYSGNVGIAAGYCATNGKTLIPASATSEQLMRAFSSYNFLWCLTENDISQCELLLATAIRKGARSVSLLTDKGLYGQTFLDWFAFQAKELKIAVHRVEQYTSLADLDAKMNRLLQEETDCLVCIPTDDATTRLMNRIRTEHPPRQAFLLFSDVAFLSSPDDSFEGMEGIAQIQNPASAFNEAYEVRYGVSPGYAAPHFYDAVMLAGLALFDARLTNQKDLNSSLRRLVCGQEMPVGWTAAGIHRAVVAIGNGQLPRISGASGELRFDTTLFTDVLHSYYCHWIVRQGKHVILAYTTSDNSERTHPSVINWNWDILDTQQSFSTSSFVYPPRQNLHALIVAASAEWKNYRHQSDAYSLYQLLKGNGLSDENILLIAEDDLAYNKANPAPGYIQTSISGPNVYRDMQIDYHLSELRPDDLRDILSGGKRADLPQVIQSDSTDNLLVYWVGHAGTDRLGWHTGTFSMDVLASMFRRLMEQKQYRKIFIVMETCYAGAFGRRCEGIPGLLCLTATDERETSKASHFDIALRVWRSNSFSDNLFQNLSSEKNMKLYDLYCQIYKSTIGSHVSVYNAEYFDNLYQNGIHEFIRP